MQISSYIWKDLRPAALAFMTVFQTIGTLARPLTPPSFIVASGSYSYWIFEVPRSGRVSGQFRVQDGGGRDIEVFIIDEGEYENFRNRRPFRSYYSSNRVSEGEITLRLYSGRYIIVFDNRSSSNADKAIVSNLQLEED